MQIQKALRAQASFGISILALFLSSSFSSLAQQNTSSAGGTQSVAAPAVRPPQAMATPGLDPKTGKPLYETIVEDWSSLQIGNSQLLPVKPMVAQTEDQPKFTRQLVQVQWRPGDPIDLWIALPNNVKKPPVVLYLYNFTEDTDRFKDNGWCERATSGGVAAVGFVSALSGHRFHDRPLKQWFVSEFQESLGSTVHDVKFILDYLNLRGDVDMSDVGMFGEGSGGTIAILAAAADPRIKAVDALDPWGDWPDFLAKSPVIDDDPNRAAYLKPEFLQKVAPLDPVKWLPQLKEPIRIQQVRQNEATPMECKESIKAAAPKQTELVRFDGLMDLGKREGGGRLFGWIKDRLREPDKSAPGDQKVAVQGVDGLSHNKN
jgi:acetyl esterase/lipase